MVLVRKSQYGAVLCCAMPNQCASIKVLVERGFGCAGRRASRPHYGRRQHWHGLHPLFPTNRKPPVSSRNTSRVHALRTDRRPNSHWPCTAGRPTNVTRRGLLHIEHDNFCSFHISALVVTEALADSPRRLERTIQEQRIQYQAPNLAPCTSQIHGNNGTCTKVLISKPLTPRFGVPRPDAHSGQDGLSVPSDPLFAVGNGIFGTLAAAGHEGKRSRE